jgi:hypothetical protein
MHGASSKVIAGQNQEGRIERLRRSAHLRDAIAQRAQERGDSPTDIARLLDMSVGHWYRLKKDPLRLARLPLERLDTIARYVGWTRVQVMIAIGWVHEAEIDERISAEGAVHAALQRLERGGLANGVTTPIAKAAADHKRLMARLLIAAEGAAAAKSS